MGWLIGGAWVLWAVCGNPVAAPDVSQCQPCCASVAPVADRDQDRSLALKSLECTATVFPADTMSPQCLADGIGVTPARCSTRCAFCSAPARGHTQTVQLSSINNTSPRMTLGTAQSGIPERNTNRSVPKVVQDARRGLAFTRWENYSSLIATGFGVNTFGSANSLKSRIFATTTLQDTAHKCPRGCSLRDVSTSAQCFANETTDNVAVMRQWLVFFHSNLHVDRATEVVLNQCAQFAVLSVPPMCTVVRRTNIFARLPSDFVTVQLAISAVGFDPKEFHYAMMASTEVRAVHRERRLRVNPLSTTRARTLHMWDEHNRSSSLKNRGRKLLWGHLGQHSVTEALDADSLWRLGYSGAGINVAIFDTGLAEGHPHFNNVIERTVWTGEASADDRVGHGSFVAGVVASTYSDCPGFAPDSRLHIYKVFDDHQTSYTSWFLDAFNYAMQRGIDVLNLSIGGPDFQDEPFVDKVRELAANGIIMVSAIGNDGPLFGTLNNPADQPTVIGVGGVDFGNDIAAYSSRGMPTYGLPSGYGPFKPDVVAYGSQVFGSSPQGGCRSLTGTSVSSPVVAGAVVLLASVIPKSRRSELLNPASIKQALLETATRIRRPSALLNEPGIFEQGHGIVNLRAAHDILKTHTPRITIVPSEFDSTDCPYMSPYCEQPLYYRAIPTVTNFTILNGLGLFGEILEPPRWIPRGRLSDDMLDVSISYSRILWPWTGWLALKFSASPASAHFDGIVEGRVEVVAATVQSDGSTVRSSTSLPIRVHIIPTPARRHRLLWDQFHNIGYPAGYFPRDNLMVDNDPLDWNGDHPHTNFRGLFRALRDSGYYVDVLTSPFTCYDPVDYAALLIVDPEEEYYQGEIKKLVADVRLHGMGVVVIAEWYSEPLIKHVRFFDDNTENWWNAETGGANVPALNNLLAPHGIEIAGGAFEADGFVMSARLRNGEVRILERKDVKEDVVVLGLHQPQGADPTQVHGGSGRIAVFGDSSPFDDAHAVDGSPSWWLFKMLLEYVILGITPASLAAKGLKLRGDMTLGESMADRVVNSTLFLYSKVIREGDRPGMFVERAPPHCARHVWARPHQETDHSAHIFAQDTFKQSEHVDRPPEKEIAKETDPFGWLELCVVLSVFILLYRLRFGRRQLWRLPQMV